MESSVGSAIENIKRQEQNKEAKLKAQREYEANKTALERSIKEVISQIKKLEEGEAELNKKSDKLRSDLTIQKLRRDALLAQYDASRAELNTLKTKWENTMTELQELRSRYCETVQEVADYCDVWPLLMRPVLEEPRPVVKPEPEQLETKKMAQATEETIVYEEKLKSAQETLVNVKTERDRLLAEPDVGEEFVSTRHCKYRNNRQFSKKTEHIEDGPIPFSTSPAAKRVIKPVMRHVVNTAPWYQTYSVIGSVSAILIYFCCLREESDIDKEFTKTLYDRIEGLEKHQLIQTYKFNKEHGKSTIEIEKRLKELELMEREADWKV